MKTAVALVLLCCVAAQASRLALEEDFSSADFIGRGLLQRTLDCTKVHPACATCRNQRKAGSRTSEHVCSTCITGWRLRRDGISKTCDCAPGLYKNSTGSCVSCTPGQFCLGGSATNPLSTANNCTDGLATTFSGAKSIQQCFTIAGYGRVSVRTANNAVTLQSVECPVGTYNVGKNTAGCQKCPAGLTTNGTMTKSAADCLAPAGSYIDKGIGKLCPKGTYSTDLNTNSACSACPTGITTAGEGSTFASDCKYAMRGFWMDTNVTAQPCDYNTYNDGETLTVGQQCPDCPYGWRTKDRGADGEALCLAPPGFELKAGATNISECENKYYKADWNRNNCTYCGDNLKTNDTASVSKDACLVPVGFGIATLSPLAAQQCNNNTYGVDADRTVSAASTCTPCDANTYTLDTLNNTVPTGGYTNRTDCKVKPGWGLTPGGLAEQCLKGTYNDGLNREQCKPCPAGYTTLQAESTSSNDCVIQPGWYLQITANGTRLPAPCNIGSWSAGGNAIDREPTTCTDCDAAWTTQTDESTNATDCNVCQAGYGGVDCPQCTYNHFSYAGHAPEVGCTECASSSVSRRRATEAAMCYSQYQDTVRDVFSTSANWTTPQAVQSSAECAGDCLADGNCITYRFSKDSNNNGVCELLQQYNQSSNPQELYFKLGNGGSGADYVKYTFDPTATFGVDTKITTTAATAAACMAECTKTGDCEVASMVGGVCTLRASELDSEYSGMWVVRGDHIVSDAGL